jgi:ABC-type dipeptide/oligopeptide/nickel transport system permease subunit
MVFPALAISIVVIGVNLFADGLKSVFFIQDKG